MSLFYMAQLMALQAEIPSLPWRPGYRLMPVATQFATQGGGPDFVAVLSAQCCSLGAGLELQPFPALCALVALQSALLHLPSLPESLSYWDENTDFPKAGLNLQVLPLSEHIHYG